jgi:hypothetical protein
MGFEGRNEMQMPEIIVISGIAGYMVRDHHCDRCFTNIEYNETSW